MVSAVAVDDEQEALDALKLLLQKYCPEVKLKATARGVDEAVQVLENAQPHVLFLDINMPKASGFELLDRIDLNRLHVIFITAFDQYAVRAFEYGAVDYLLKPIDSEDLQRAVSRVSSVGRKAAAERIEVALDNLLRRKPTKIAVPSQEGYQFIPVDQICYMQADGSYTQIFMVNETRILTSRRLNEVEDLLSGDDFFRVHRSYLINVNKVEQYHRLDGGKVVVEGGKEVLVSRRRRQALLERLGLKA